MKTKKQKNTRIKKKKKDKLSNTWTEYDRERSLYMVLSLKKREAGIQNGTTVLFTQKHKTNWTSR